MAELYREEQLGGGGDREAQPLVLEMFRVGYISQEGLVTGWA